MLADAAAADVMDLAVLVVETAEKERAGREFAQFFGMTAELVAERFGVGTRGGDVLAGDDTRGGAFGHRGQSGPAEVVVVAFLAERMLE